MDFNADGVVNELDVNAFMGAVSTHPGEAGWDARFDLNGDLVIASQDRGILLSFFGSTDCTAADLENPPTMWTGTTEYHDTLCPGGDVALAVQDPDATDGSALYVTLLEPEECLRAPVVAEFTYYACIVNGAVTSAHQMEPISPEYVSSEGNHVCNPAASLN